MARCGLSEWGGSDASLRVERFDEDAYRWRDYLNANGVPTTEIKDRAYFRSIYFHDPDGHIVEIATDTPGFTTDEPMSELGRTLQLPPWLQPRRSEIERLSRRSPSAIRLVAREQENANGYDIQPDGNDTGSALDSPPDEHWPRPQSRGPAACHRVLS